MFNRGSPFNCIRIPWVLNRFFTFKYAIKEIKTASIKIAVDSVKKIITTSVDKSKLDTLYQKNLDETKEELKKINNQKSGSYMPCAFSKQVTWQNLRFSSLFFG